jgi:hypothetical protein
MGHSYKGQALPFKGDSEGSLATPAPVLQSTGSNNISWAEARPPGYDTLVYVTSLDGGLTFLYPTAVAATAGAAGLGNEYLRKARFTNGSAYTAFSNIVLTI